MLVGAGSRVRFGSGGPAGEQGRPILAGRVGPGVGRVVGQILRGDVVELVVDVLTGLGVGLDRLPGAGVRGVELGSLTDQLDRSRLEDRLGVGGRSRLLGGGRLAGHWRGVGRGRRGTGGRRAGGGHVVSLFSPGMFARMRK